MIERDGAFWAVCCDGCSNSEDDIGTDVPFGRLVQDLKASGWRVRKHDGEFLHMCPSCVEDGKAAA